MKENQFTFYSQRVLNKECAFLGSLYRKPVDEFGSQSCLEMQNYLLASGSLLLLLSIVTAIGSFIKKCQKGASILATVIFVSFMPIGIAGESFFFLLYYSVHRGNWSTGTFTCLSTPMSLEISTSIFLTFNIHHNYV